MKIRGNTVGTTMKPEKIAERISAKGADRHADYFTITDDGIISLKPEYRGACSSNRSGFTFAISDNGLGKTGSKNSELPECLAIPEVVNEIAVTSLADGMFLSNLGIVEIVLPDFITAIPQRFCDMAFGLTQISNTDNVLDIGTGAFQGTHLEKAKFPSLKTMGTFSFNNCSFLVYADIGNVTEVPQSAFMGDMMLSRIKGGESVTKVGNNAFYCCYRLNKVDFLPKLKSIGNNAFLRCRLLFNWSSLSGCTFGTKATALQLNPTDIWSACTVTPVENPVPTLLSQYDPRWANRKIGTSETTYSAGCVSFTAMHIYCALHNLTLSSVEEFENIVNGKDPNLLNNFSQTTDSLVYLLNGLGLTVEHYSSYTQTTLQAVYKGLSEGKYAAIAYTGQSVEHVAMAYGVNDKKELLIADSIFSGYMLGETEKTIKYPMAYQNGTRPSHDIIVVSL